MTGTALDAARQGRPPSGRALAALECRGLTVTVPGRTLVERFELELLPARVVVVLGRNGAGKSSLLHALAGLNPFARGEVRVQGRGLSSWARRDLARRLALLPQAYWEVAATPAWALPCAM